MPDTQLADMTLETSPASTDLFYLIINPGTLPEDRGITLADVALAISTELGLGALALLDDVTDAEVDAAAAIDISKLAITGTPDGTQFLRDDGTWAAVGGSGGGIAFDAVTAKTADYSIVPADVRTLFTTDGAALSTTLTISDDAGWAAGDVVAVVQTEKYPVTIGTAGTALIHVPGQKATATGILTRGANNPVLLVCKVGGVGSEWYAIGETTFAEQTFSANFTLEGATHAARTYRLTGSTDRTVTIGGTGGGYYSSVGDQVILRQGSTGRILAKPAAGVTITGWSTLNTRGQGSAIRLTNVSTNTWQGEVIGVDDRPYIKVVAAGATITGYDVGYVYYYAGTGTITFTLPDSTDTDFPDMAEVHFMFMDTTNAGSVTIAPGAGNTLFSPGGLASVAQYGFVTARRSLTAGGWILTGDLI